MFSALLMLLGDSEVSGEGWLAIVDRLGVPLTFCVVLGVFLYKLLLYLKEKDRDLTKKFYDTLEFQQTMLVRTTLAVENSNDNFAKLLARMENSPCIVEARRRSNQETTTTGTNSS